MPLVRDLLYKSGITDIQGKTVASVDTVCFSSNQAGPGSLFVAVRGTKTDGHRYIGDAVEKGACVIVCEQTPAEQDTGVMYVQVKDSASALGHIASNFFNNPSDKLKLTGVTGTNGKTTTTTLLHRMFRDLGYHTGLIGTIRNLIDELEQPATHTTPDPIALNRLLADMVAAGCTHCFMEVSSHAVHQKRIAGLSFAGGVLTNISHDHLDYHETFDAYLKAKQAFFTALGRDRFALVNADDRNARVMLQHCSASHHTYSLRSMSDTRGRIMENSLSGLLMNIDGTEVSCRLTGTFNAYNLLAAYATARLLGIERQDALKAVSRLEPVEGRFQHVVSANKITGIVDYAHTPDALLNVLRTLSDIRTGNESVITVVGCGGDRDRQKRPVMAKIACELSDKVILTSDNPRSEDPMEIIRQMQSGVPPQHYRKVLAIVDRREAIRTACSLAVPGDLILVAGKGHEKYQEEGGRRTPFDDLQVLQETFDEMINAG